jgi:hypothetical protein
MLDVIDRARALLSDSQQPDLRRLHVDRRGDLIQIRGSVASFYLKQMAQETIRHAIGNLRLDNRIHVEGRT